MRRLIATITTTLLCGALLSGCGSDVPGVDIDAMKDAAESQQDAGQQNAGQDADDQENPASKKLKPIEFRLPETANVPNDFREIPAKCDTDSSEAEYRSWYRIAVPENWESGGITGGSSAPLNEGTTLKFGTGSDRASVDALSDSIMPDGSISAGQGEKWTTFDYDYTAGDDSGTVNFEEFATASIDGQDVTIMAAPYQQNPEYLKVTEYKARIKAANLYSRYQDASRAYEASFVVTIKPTREDRELDKDVVTGIVGSYAMPQCARELVVVSEEVNVQKDVDGDGSVATIDDYKKILGAS